MKSNWLDIALWKKISRFLGPRVIRFLAFGILVGLALFVVELGFAYGLQGFLIGLGVMSSSTVNLPNWVPHQSLLQILLFIFLIGASRAFLLWAQVFLVGSVVEEFKFLQRSRLITWAFYSQSVSSSEVTTLFNERTGVTSGTLASLQALMVKLTTAVFVGLTLMWLSPTLTLMSSVALGLMVIPLKVAEKRIRRAGDEVASTWNKINQRLYINIKNLLLMQIYGTQEHEKQLAQQSLNEYRRHIMEYTWLSGVVSSIPQFLGVLLVCLITIAAKYTHQLSPSALISYFYLFFRFLQTFSAISLDATTILHSWPQVASLAKWWADHAHDGVRSMVNESKPTAMEKPLFNGPIGWSLSNVTFSYSASARPLVTKLSLQISPGSTCVITGPSGAGKTTLLNLLLGNLTPDSGTIEVHASHQPSSPLQDARKNLLKEIGYVGPESFLIEGTIRKNLLYGILTPVTDDEITQALKLAECQFILENPQGIEQTLTEQGHGLSAGQKQRISLARALLRKPKALILDEPTANLDIDTEARLAQTLDRLKGKVTLVIVSHREKLLELADQKLEIARLSE